MDTSFLSTHLHDQIVKYVTTMTYLEKSFLVSRIENTVLTFKKNCLENVNEIQFYMMFNKTKREDVLLCLFFFFFFKSWVFGPYCA